MPKFECVARLKFPLKKRFTLSRVFFKKFFAFMPIGSKDLFYLTGLALLVYQINQTFFGKEPWTTFKVGHDSYSNLQSPSKIAKKRGFTSQVTNFIERQNQFGKAKNTVT